jgi:hypothetical protein
LITFAFCEKEGIVGVTGLEVGGVSIVDGVTGLDTAGVVECDTLGRGIVSRLRIFEAVLAVLAEADTCECETGLGILDGCDLLGVLGTLGGRAPRINKHFF